jgi:hypothetical protein
LEKTGLKMNYVGIVAGIIAFISLALPWWTVTASVGAMEISMSVDVSVYLYQVKASAMGASETVTMDLWFGWTALVLIVIAGITGICGGVIAGKTGKLVLITAGMVALLSIIVFVAGLQCELSKASPVPVFQK